MGSGLQCEEYGIFNFHCTCLDQEVQDAAEGPPHADNITLFWSIF